MPTPDDILGGLISRIPEQKLPGKEACSLIADIFSNLAEAHKFYARAAKGLADITGLVSPEQLILILAAVVLPTLQLVMPPGQISPLSTPPPPPETSTTSTGRQEMIQYCKKQILPDHLANSFNKCEPRSPMRVLAAAIFSTLEKHLFEVAANFSITPAQLHKAITGVDYKKRSTYVQEKEKCNNRNSHHYQYRREDNTGSIYDIKSSIDHKGDTSRRHLGFEFRFRFSLQPVLTILKLSFSTGCDVMMLL